MIFFSDTTPKDLINCTKSIIYIIEYISDAVKYLEMITTPSKVDHLFKPLENIHEYLQKTLNNQSVSNLKVNESWF